MRGFGMFFSGNLIRDPELRKVKERSVLSFTVAVDTNKKKVDANGNPMKNEYGRQLYEANFIDCNLWGIQGETLYPLLQKGTAVVVNGTGYQDEYTSADGVVKHRLRADCTTVDAITRLRPKNEKPAAPAADEDAPF